MTAPLYRQLSQARLKMLLHTLERNRRTAMTEPLVYTTKLTIEHLMPQDWRAHWALAPGANDAAAHERDSRLHRLGNLTLLTGSLNSSVSNGLWPDKRAAIQEHGALLLNNRDLPDDWDENAIDERGNRLAQAVLAMWPGPNA